MDDRAPLAAVGVEPQRSPDVSFIGRGIAWPMGVDHTGALRMSDGAADLDRSMRVVIATAPGERVMRSEFGCRIWDMLFEPVTATLIGSMAQAVRDAITQWEPRVTVEDVDVRQDDDNHALVHIAVRYVVRSTNDRRNLVYPFYVIPREED
jgi:phage baseplate assembly protein W